MRVAIQGYPGSFHHQVAQSYFSQGVISVIPCDTFVAEAQMVIDKSAQVAVMAIENSIAGSILPNYNILQNDCLKVVGETYLSIEQCLMVLPDVGIEELEIVSSHPMALLQCEQWLADKGFRLEQSVDTALSAKMVADKKLRNVAAIASAAAAQLYGLKILERGINVPKSNFTRFLIVVRADNGAFDAQQVDKASMFFNLPHSRGALGRILKIVELYELNMTKLQSYPIPSDPFCYNFHLDVEFGDKSSFESACELMARYCDKFSLYGVYKSANI